MPRETPLSANPPRNMLTLREAGATILSSRPASTTAQRRWTISSTSSSVVHSTSSGSRTRSPSVGTTMTVETGTLPAESVRRMFDRIAPVYDVMNHVMTAGLDRRWRRITIDETVRQRRPRARRVLRGPAISRSVAHARGADVVGLDFSERMLERARHKEPAIEWVRGDVLALPFDDASFDSATVGFGRSQRRGPRGRPPRAATCAPPGGRLGILELTTPRGALAPFYRVWFDRIVPLLGKVLPGGAAYTYLPASVRRFPGPDALVELLEVTGFGDVRYRLFAGSIVALHVGEAR